MRTDRLGDEYVAGTSNDSGPEVGLVEAAWRYRWASLGVIVVCALLSALVTQFLLTSVSATARFAVIDPRGTTFLRQGVQSESSFIAYTAQRATFAASADVLRRANELMTDSGGQPLSLQRMRQAVMAEPTPEGGIVAVTATAKDDRTAAVIANAVVTAYQELTAAEARREQRRLLEEIRDIGDRIQSDLDEASDNSPSAGALRETLVQLQLKESDAAVDLVQYGSGTRFVDQADPEQTTPSQLPKNTLIGVALGTLLALVISFLRATRSVTGPAGSERRPAGAERPADNGQPAGAEQPADNGQLARSRQPAESGQLADGETVRRDSADDRPVSGAPMPSRADG